MPLRNTATYLLTLFRPLSLRPDLRIPTISHVDWERVRRDGYNAVVIDKDNCLTYPHRDSLHPSITKGWANLKHAFGPGNVLVVSNSAGTQKDPGGIIAESVSRALGVPVLLHPTPKPGCTADVVMFFRGEMPLHSVGRGRLADLGRGKDGWDVVVRSEEVVRSAFSAEVMVGEEESGTLLGRPSTISPPSTTTTRRLPPPITAINQPNIPPIVHRTPLEDPRILVIGDRLATDVLLARKLARFYRPDRTSNAHLSDQKPVLSDQNPVLSVVTTHLFKPTDVRLLRWIEESHLQLGLALRQRFTRPVPTPSLEAELQHWILPRSVDAPPLEVPPHTGPTPVSLVGRMRNLRESIQRWTSPTAWRTWATSLIPSRAQLWLVLKTSVRRVGRAVVRLVGRFRGVAA